MEVKATMGRRRNTSFSDIERRTNDMNNPGMKNERIGIKVRARLRHTRTAKGRMCSGCGRKSGLGCTGRCKSKIFQEKAIRRRMYANVSGRGVQEREARKEINTRPKGGVAKDQV